MYTEICAGDVYLKIEAGPLSSDQEPSFAENVISATHVKLHRLQYVHFFGRMNGGISRLLRWMFGVLTQST